MITILSSLSIITILSLSTIWSTIPSLFQNQAVFVLISILIFLLFSRLDSKLLERLSPLLYVSAIAMLLLTMIIGESTRGSVRWIDIGPFRFQSSEFSKPLLSLCLASFLVHSQSNFFTLIKSIVLIAIPGFLVFIQPDLGSALVLFALWLGTALSSGIPWKYFLLLFLIALVSLPYTWQHLKPYQKQRIETFINPYQDPKGTGYNVIQSQIAVGSGRIIGKGIRQGTQSQLKFLPERHTDFAFASFAEEFGFVGVILLLTSYGFLLNSLLDLAKTISDPTGKLFTLAFFSATTFQILVNVGMNLAIMPVTGITLPFFSYGGSSLLSNAIFLGLIASYQKNRK